MEDGARLKFKRRTFLKASALSSAAVMISACGRSREDEPPAPAEQATDATRAEVGSDYNESPMLAERVAAGELPPVAERLPPRPEVVVPLNELGQYGGQSVVSISRANYLFGDPQSVIGTELILRIDSDFSSITGGLAESWEFQEGGTVQILHLRPGMKWSDGSPFTAEDFIFAWEDLWNNSDFSPAGPPAAWHTGTGAGRKPMSMEMLDPYTLKLTFAQPYPLIVLHQAFYPGAQGGLWQPFHYLQQFHPRHRDPTELQNLVEDAGPEISTWDQLLKSKGRVSSTIPAQTGLPGMTAFVRVEDAPDRHTYERNPFYWKVDTEGNQLPYIDSTLIHVIDDREVSLAKLIAGELTFAGQRTQLRDMGLYEQNLETANIKIKMWDSTFPSKTVIVPNHTAKEANLRAFFRTKGVRQALSMALDREEISQKVYFGLGEPRQWSVWPHSRYYREGDERHWAQHDVDEANRLLDEAGYDLRDVDGFRLHPDGSRVAWNCQLDEAQHDVVQVFEVAVGQWHKVGLDVGLAPISRPQLNELVARNEVQMSGWEGDISDFTWVWNSRLNHPSHGDVRWGRAWQLWLAGDTEHELAEEPPEEVKWVDKTWQEMIHALTDDQHVTKARELWAWFYEYLPGFGTVGIPQPIAMRKNFTNFPDEGVWGYSVIRAVPVHPEQFFFKT